MTSIGKTDQLSEEQTERLAILMEECAEVSQIIGKILRFGFESKFPGDGESNRERLEAELRDVLVATLLMLENNDISAKSLDWGKQYEKRIKMSNWVLNQSRSPKDVLFEFRITSIPSFEK